MPAQLLEPSEHGDALSVRQLHDSNVPESTRVNYSPPQAEHSLILSFLLKLLEQAWYAT
jgi:hypothetical protein